MSSQVPVQPVKLTNLFRYCKYTDRDPKQTLRDIQLRIVKSFFDWLCNQRRGKGGRRVQGVRSANTLGTYWKVFRLVYERETDEKIPGKFNRQARRVRYEQLLTEFTLCQLHLLTHAGGI